MARLKALEEAAAPLVSFLQNANAVQELRADKQYNLQMLNDRYQVSHFSLGFLFLFFYVVAKLVLFHSFNIYHKNRILVQLIVLDLGLCDELVLDPSE